MMIKNYTSDIKYIYSRNSYVIYKKNYIKKKLSMIIANDRYRTYNFGNSHHDTDELRVAVIILKQNYPGQKAQLVDHVRGSINQLIRVL